MAWNMPAAIHAELRGDGGPWERHLKAAWRASITEARDVPLPRDPSQGYATNPQSPDWHAKVIAYWAPMLQLLVFGLGWPRPDIGLARWRERGYPDQHPILRTVLRWWGKDGVEDFLAWAQARDGFGNLAGWLGQTANVPTRQSGFPLWPGLEELELARRTPEWQAIWSGGSDPHHLLSHAMVAVEPRDEFLTNPQVLDAGSIHGTRVLMLDIYAGWYRELLGLRPLLTPTEPPRIDVVIKPVGWLGTYTLSPETGLWYRGEHAVHLLGTWSP